MRIILMILVAAFALVSCDNGGGSKKKDDPKVGGGDPSIQSVDSDGNCTQAYLEDYTAVLQSKRNLEFKLNSLSSTEKEKNQSLEDTSNSCENFYQNHGQMACVASIDGNNTTISGDDFREFCDKVDKAIEELDSIKNRDNSTKDDSNLESARNLNVRVLKKNTFEQLAKNEGAMIHGGVVYRSDNEVSDAKSYELLKGFCMLGPISETGYIPGSVYAAEGVSAEFYQESLSDDGSTRILMINIDNVLFMSCAKSININTPFTISDINAIFNGVARISVTK